MPEPAPNLPTPHLDKLKTLFRNRRLPSADRPRVEEALEKYHAWIGELERVTPGQKNSVRQLVEATNRYKRFVELQLIFDSPEDFLYRQKGQLKLDNTILEEFLPQLVYRSVRLTDHSFEFGPRNTFAGLSFTSSIVDTGAGGHPRLRTKDQDFVVGKRLYLMASFDREFRESEVIESQLGYVCGMQDEPGQDDVPGSGGYEPRSEDSRTVVAVLPRMRVLGHDTGFDHFDADR